MWPVLQNLAATSLKPSTSREHPCELSPPRALHAQLAAAALPHCQLAVHSNVCVPTLPRPALASATLRLSRPFPAGRGYKMSPSMTISPNPCRPLVCSITAVAPLLLLLSLTGDRHPNGCQAPCSSEGEVPHLVAAPGPLYGHHASLP
jgi:hypothetical protein